MNKNTLIGLVLIVLVLVGYSYLMKPKLEAQQAQQHITDSIKQVDAKQAEIERQKTIVSTEKNKDIAITDFFGRSSSSASPVANTGLNRKVPVRVRLENQDMIVSVACKGGQIENVFLKNYKKYDGSALNVYGEASNYSLVFKSKDGQLLRTDALTFTPIVQKDNSLIMRYSYSNDQYIDFIYQFSDKDFMLKFDINAVGIQPLLSRNSNNLFEMEWQQKLLRQEQNIKNEQRYSHLYYKYLGGDVESLSERKSDHTEATEPTKWIGFKNQFFASVMIADDQIDNALLNSDIAPDNQLNHHIKSCTADIQLPARVDTKAGTMSTGLTFYFGPMGFSHLRHYDSHVSDSTKRLDLDKMIPLGWTLFRWINQYFVIPIFNFLENMGLSTGLAILILTLIVKLIISPLTFKSFMSSAKMRVLKPQIDEISAKYPNKDQAMDKQRATMDLYQRAGANPMSGCLPMVLQMPLLISLFEFFPNAIELRQHSFLWAKDLSTYDAFITWKQTIPLLGNHLSLFCILMTITNVIYTKFNMEMTNSGGQQQMPGMKFMMYIMPLIFLFVLNDYPAGLNYYYFISLLITILLTLGFRFMVNEEKLLAKLEANKAKPKKKSGFMARLQDAQKEQQKQMRDRNKSNSKGRR